MQRAIPLNGQELEQGLGVTVMPRLVDDHIVTGAHLEAPQQRHAQPCVVRLHGHAVSPFGPTIKDTLVGCIVRISYSDITENFQESKSYNNVTENYKNEKNVKRTPQ